jgi:hypothetical protein
LINLCLTLLADFNQEFTLLDNRTSVNHTIEDVVPQKKVVFVGNLPINRTEDFIRHELEILFNKHEPCSMNFHLGGPKPYAFIEFVVSSLWYRLHVRSSNLTQSAIAALKAQKKVMDSLSQDDLYEPNLQPQDQQDSFNALMDMS